MIGNCPHWPRCEHRVTENCNAGALGVRKLRPGDLIPEEFKTFQLRVYVEGGAFHGLTVGARSSWDAIAWAQCESWGGDVRGVSAIRV